MKQILLSLLLFLPLFAAAQTPSLHDAVKPYFAAYTVSGYSPRDPMRADSVAYNATERIVRVYVNEAFSAQPFTPTSVKLIYATLQRLLPAPYNTFKICVVSPKGALIEDLIPNALREADKADRSRLWGDVAYDGAPWVTPTSRPFIPTHGLAGRHLCIWPSHGRYFRDGTWRWQRPYLFCTTEDLLTQSIVYPYLFPMLENAGAVVYSPRERDSQQHEAVVDNDAPQRQGSYTETQQTDFSWRTIEGAKGFAAPEGLLTDSVMPFTLGTAREIAATTRRSRLAQATWTPRVPQRGRYAVYVSYAQRPNSVPDAHYTVYHRGGRTQFKVNQTMGGGTWVYLGTFEFDEGQNTTGRIVLTNHSLHRGVVTADGVRLGGGMGQTERGLVLADSTFNSGGTSGLPRVLEAARYQAQWCGLPDTLYNAYEGRNDYFDDLRVRANLLNFLAEGSPYVPQASAQIASQALGCRVPFELALALHSDAGRTQGDSIVGSLSICTTLTPDGATTLPSGLSRATSRDFAAMLLSDVQRDLSAFIHRSWTRRELWDRNYAETRMPAVPSAILEMFSHQNFADMKRAHDPHFKFTLARAIYKSILRFTAATHGISNYEVQPLPPQHFSAILSEDESHVTLAWRPTVDTLETTAQPTAYVVYTQAGEDDFDNGQLVENGATQVTLPVTRGVRYCFRVTAVNGGGESFPSETLSVFATPSASKGRVLIVNAFTRLSAPAQVTTPDSVGFLLSDDPGVPYIATTAFAGEQRNFSPTATAADEGPSAFGYSTSEWQGRTIAGNTFAHTAEHGEAIAAAGYSYASSAVSAVVDGTVALAPYAVVDYLGGLQADLPYNSRPSALFPEGIVPKLTTYAAAGGNIFLSAAYAATDLRSPSAVTFATKVMKYAPAGSARLDSTETVRGLNLEFAIHRRPSAVHYAATQPDAIVPAAPEAFSAFAYGEGQSAGVAYAGSTHRALTMAFPFECIQSTEVRNKAMAAILRFLTNKK